MGCADELQVMLFILIRKKPKSGFWGDSKTIPGTTTANFKNIMSATLDVFSGQDVWSLTIVLADDSRFWIF
jgi:hypothetical protein